MTDEPKDGSRDTTAPITPKTTKQSLVSKLLGPTQSKSTTDEHVLLQSKTADASHSLVLPIVPIREGVLFPSTESVLTFGRPGTIAALEQAKFTQNLIVLVTQKKSAIDNPLPEDLYQVGTLAKVEHTLNADDQINALVRGVSRVEIVNYVQSEPFLTAQVEKVVEPYIHDEETTALLNHLQKQFRRAVNLGKPVEFLNFMKLMGGGNDSQLIDQIASTLNISTKKKQQLLELFNVKQRLAKVVEYLVQEVKILEIEKDVAHKTQEQFEKNMRENVLRERIRTIQKELGEIDDEAEVVDEYQQRLKKTKFPPEIAKKVKKELQKLKQMSPNNPEAGYVRTWLDTMLELPWENKEQSAISLSKAEQTLNSSHYSLAEVKDRILEYIAVLQLKQQTKKSAIKNQTSPTILCFVGPPGVGKTSIGKSIAEALGRSFVKVSLGGIRDEAEIRGHRRTYVGAMPGRIISGMKQAGSLNPVFMLDEIDKIGNDFRGDPSAALLEALDPEQNANFEDHYLDVPYDLSQVLFITTANTLDTIPSALRDRLEVIRYAGYTADEKFHIAKQHLIQKQRNLNGISSKDIILPDSIVKKIINHFTKEAGVRDLERSLNKIMRKVARKLVESNHKGTPIRISQRTLTRFLGPEQYDISLTEQTDQVGLATGLAWTQVGGDVLFIEVSLTPGKGTIQLTGKLGEIMKESAQTALTYVKAHAQELGVSQTDLDKHNVHLHVPEGAVPKDGPSAGITIATAIVSAFTKQPVKRDVAMTGEITLRGRVLRIGGLKEKSIAAHRAGCKTIIIPESNLRDLKTIPQQVKKDIDFIGVSTVDQVFEQALAKKIEQKT